MSVVYSLYDALVSIKIPDEKAKAVIDAMEREMMGKLATKADLMTLHSEMGGEFKLARQEMTSMKDGLSRDVQALDARLHHEMAQLSATLTIRMGTMAIVGIGALYTLLRLT